MSAFKRLSEVDVRNKRVFIRSDLNVPQDDSGAITDDTRIRASLPAIRDALARGAAVMVTSHLGRPTEGTFSESDSLAPIAMRMRQLLDRDVPLVRDQSRPMRIRSAISNSFGFGGSNSCLAFRHPEEVSV